MFWESWLWPGRGLSCFQRGGQPPSASGPFCVPSGPQLCSRRVPGALPHGLAHLGLVSASVACARPSAFIRWGSTSLTLRFVSTLLSHRSRRWHRWVPRAECWPSAVHVGARSLPRGTRGPWHITRGRLQTLAAGAPQHHCES